MIEERKFKFDVVSLVKVIEINKEILVLYVCLGCCWKVILVIEDKI